MDAYTLDDLCVMITSADPEIRDKVAYGQLWDRIAEGGVDGGLRELGDRMAAQLAHPEIQARTFAPLVLVSVLLRDEVAQELDAPSVRGWLAAFVDWFTHEEDLRGYDEKLGWLHAVAHGADAIEAFSRSRHLRRAELVQLSAAVTTRLATPAGYLFAHGEEDRLGSSAVALLLREELSAADATEWIAPLAAVVKGAPGPTPIRRSNTLRTLNSLYVACHRGVRLYDPAGMERPVAWPPHKDAVLEAVADCLRGPMDYLG